MWRSKLFFFYIHILNKPCSVLYLRCANSAKVFFSECFLTCLPTISGNISKVSKLRTKYGFSFLKMSRLFFSNVFFQLHIKVLLLHVVIQQLLWFSYMHPLCSVNFTAIYFLFHLKSLWLFEKNPLQLQVVHLTLSTLRQTWWWHCWGTSKHTGEKH